MRLFTMLVWFVSFVLFFPLYSSELFGFETGDEFYISEEISEEVALAEMLDRILDFFFSNFETVNIDGLLGIVITEGQLNLMLHKLRFNTKLFDRVLNLQKKSHNLIKLLKSSVKLLTPAYQKIYDSILKTSIWEFDNNFVNGSLQKFPPYNWTEIPLDLLIRRMFYDGSPNGKQSEACIVELIDFSAGSYGELHDCLPSLGCTTIMSILDKSHGYPLTHKLLYVQLARALMCRIDIDVLKKNTNFLCSRILQEFRALDVMTTKNPLLQDLYLEQMVLCGVEGYTEFLDSKSRENLMLWQSTYGCYGRDRPQLFNRWRKKREIAYMKYGCESHITGLASAAISLNLHYLASISPNHKYLESSEEADDFGNILMFSNTLT